jgi:hypothetical protein
MPTDKIKDVTRTPAKVDSDLSDNPTITRTEKEKKSILTRFLEFIKGERKTNKPNVEMSEK